MKQTPILFSSPMVQALLNGKTQTRRTKKLDDINEHPDTFEFWRINEEYAKFVEVGNNINEHFIKCPSGKVGDILWVREAWMHGCMSSILYKADYSDKVLKEAVKGTFTWKPSIHMQKAACRLWLEITNIKVERLHSITEADALKEGIRVIPQGEDPDWYENYLNPDEYCTTPEKSFESLWAKLNDYENWDLNPWVWVVDFKQIEKPKEAQP